MNNKVAIERCSSYKAEELYASIKKAIMAAGDFNVQGKKLLLKPNIVFDAIPEKAVCTHPEFLQMAIRLFKEMGAKEIYTGDSPGLHMPGFNAKNSGLGEAAQKEGDGWVDFSKEKVEINYSQGVTVKKFTLTKIIKEVDIIINLPKLKTHQLMCFTGAMKNLFGLVPSTLKSSFHVRCPSQKAFASMIIDLNAALNEIKELKIYNLMDAVTAMEGPGPAAGTPRHVGLVLASSNSLAMDMAACQIIGYPPDLIPINREALERGIWLSPLHKNIDYPILTPSEVCVPSFKKIALKKTAPQLLNFILPKAARRILESFAPRPEINYKLCIGCCDCEKICASRVIIKDQASGKIQIKHEDCIRCFCCHEVCRVSAINIVKKPIKKKD